MTCWPRLTSHLIDHAERPQHELLAIQTHERHRRRRRRHCRVVAVADDHHIVRHPQARPQKSLYGAFHHVVVEDQQRIRCVRWRCLPDQRHPRQCRGGQSRELVDPFQTRLQPRIADRLGDILAIAQHRRRRLLPGRIVRKHRHPTPPRPPQTLRRMLQPARAVAVDVVHPFVDAAAEVHARHVAFLDHRPGHRLVGADEHHPRQPLGADIGQKLGIVAVGRIFRQVEILPDDSARPVGAEPTRRPAERQVKPRPRQTLARLVVERQRVVIEMRRPIGDVAPRANLSDQKSVRHQIVNDRLDRPQPSPVMLRQFGSKRELLPGGELAPHDPIDQIPPDHAPPRAGAPKDGIWLP
jgi:hypothetical protein